MIVIILCSCVDVGRGGSQGSDLDGDSQRQLHGQAPRDSLRRALQRYVHVSYRSDVLCDACDITLTDHKLNWF